MSEENTIHIFFKSVVNDYKNDIWNLVKESDKEFIPHLTSRLSTSQINFNQKSNDDDPNSYFNELLNQNFLLATVDNKIIGFISYIDNKKFSVLTDWNNSLYISTLIVSKKWRRNHIALNLYNEFLLKTNKPVVTRTWSTNLSHINLLKRLDFNNILTIKDDRGKGIDTVYYGRK